MVNSKRATVGYTEDVSEAGLGHLGMDDFSPTAHTSQMEVVALELLKAVKGQAFHAQMAQKEHHDCVPCRYYLQLGWWDSVRTAINLAVKHGHHHQRLG